MDPAAITAALQLQPHRSWAAGAPRASPSGTRLKGHYEETYWTYRHPVAGGTELADAVRGLLRQLSAHGRFIASLRDSGGRSEFYIGWFSDRNTGEILGYDLLRDAADMKIDLAIDVYDSAMAKDPD